MRNPLARLLPVLPLICIGSNAHAAPLDLTGTWEVIGNHPSLQPESGVVPFTPAAQAAYAKNVAATKAGDLSWDNSQTCIPPGVPRIFTINQPFQILQEPDVVTFLFQLQRLVNFIYLDPKIPVNDDPTFMGQAFGKWQGDTLVGQLYGFKPNTFLDNEGMPHSEDLKITESFTPEGSSKLVGRFHIEDDQTFTKPWDAVLTFKRMPNTRIQEDICVERTKR